MGPGIAAEPHCAELEVRRSSSRADAPSRRKSFSHPRSWLARSGVASVSMGCPVSRAPSPALRSWRPLRATTRILPAVPTLSGSQAPVRRPLPRSTPLRRSWSSPPPDRFRLLAERLRSGFGPVLDLRLKSTLASQEPTRSATNRPFTALLGTVVFRAALTTPLRGIRPAAVRRSSLPAPLAGFASKILLLAPTGHPGEAQPFCRPKFHFVAVPAEIGSSFPFPPPVPCGSLGGEGRLPPDHQLKMTLFPSRAKRIRQHGGCG
jgi:hypothetical protein